MSTSPQDTQLSLRPATMKEAIAVGISPAPGLKIDEPEIEETKLKKTNALPAELCLEITKITEEAEDLQRLRLVNRAFSHAATASLQDRSTCVYIFPLQKSMARFTKLTLNPLIGPKIRQVNVMYAPPSASPKIPLACAEVASNWNMPAQRVRDIASEFNEEWTDLIYSRDFDDRRSLRTAIDSGDFERVLGEGIGRLPGLVRILMRPDAVMSGISTSPSLNLPDFLRLGALDKRCTHDKDVVQSLTLAEYSRNSLLCSLYQSSLLKSSPMDVLDALSHWLAGPGKPERWLSLHILDLGDFNGDVWDTRIARNPHLFDDRMANLTMITLTVDSHTMRPDLAAHLDAFGEEHQDLTSGPRWCALLKAATNLKALELRDISHWSAGFDNLLHLIFSTATWPKLTELSIIRDQNIKLLPFAPHLFHYSMGWYLFQKTDLDKFLLRHKSTLQKLELQNIVGLAERARPPLLSWQYIQPAFPSDPEPSLPALRQSLKLWKSELKELKVVDVIVEVGFFGVRGPVIEGWLGESEIQAMATAMDVKPTRINFPEESAEAEMGITDAWEDASRVEFNWN